MTRRALDLIGSSAMMPTRQHWRRLREDTQQWWADVLARDPNEMEEDEEPATADVAGLRSFHRKGRGATVV